MSSFRMRGALPTLCNTSSRRAAVAVMFCHSACLQHTKLAVALATLPVNSKQSFTHYNCNVEISSTVTVTWLSFCGRTAEVGSRPVHMDVSRTHTAGRTPLTEWTAIRRGHCRHHLLLNTRYEHPCPQRDSNPGFQQSSGCTPTS